MQRVFAWCAFILLAIHCRAEEICIYGTPDGKIVQVRSRADIPPKYLSVSKCIESASVQKSARRKAEHEMPTPDEVKLSGAIGHVQLSTTIGAIDLRWPRAVNELFGRTPERAVADAAMAVSRALQTGAFSSKAQFVNQPWRIIFMDENFPEARIPSALISNCHPGWMVPPADIYIVAQRAATFCSGSKVAPSEADGRLATILVHEMGHAIEYQLLQKNFGQSRMRAEGFASWFEQYASGYSSVISPGHVRAYYAQLAKASFLLQPSQWQFTGTAEDYARASMFFNAIVDRRGVPGLMDVYKTMEASGSDFIPAIERSVGWNERKLHEEVLRVLKRP